MTGQQIGAWRLADRLRSGTAWIFGLALLAVLATGAGLLHAHAQSPAAVPAAKSTQNAAAAASAQPALSQDTATDTATGTATRDEERKRQLAAQSAELLRMATALKAEVDELSVTVVRRADEIVQMTRRMRGETKLAANKD
jgi:hypothetical protein